MIQRIAFLTLAGFVLCASSCNKANTRADIEPVCALPEPVEVQVETVRYVPVDAALLEHFQKPQGSIENIFTVRDQALSTIDKCNDRLDRIGTIDGTPAERKP